ncbi:hypothetical protein BDU57DRAFT_580953 [Ampelomyces quisqualis]|uniref:Uncharacterized protein n=1 Tax=Ampelomyces quisqualis TaxID=50730 RepID=A0A6A5QAV0_AMPQU|nr:hypothetical protein BDU57DRAFT_580953 [Ampelomyces quisqualis]
MAIITLRAFSHPQNAYLALTNTTAPQHSRLHPRHANNTFPHTHLPPNYNTAAYNSFTGFLVLGIVAAVLAGCVMIGILARSKIHKYNLDLEAREKKAKMEEVELAYLRMRDEVGAGVREPEEVRLERERV